MEKQEHQMLAIKKESAQKVLDFLAKQPFHLVHEIVPHLLNLQPVEITSVPEKQQESNAE